MPTMTLTDQIDNLAVLEKLVNKLGLPVEARVREQMEHARIILGKEYTVEEFYGVPAVRLVVINNLVTDHAVKLIHGLINELSYAEFERVARMHEAR
jgi:hypothetical protein